MRPVYASEPRRDLGRGTVGQLPSRATANLNDAAQIGVSSPLRLVEICILRRKRAAQRPVRIVSRPMNGEELIP